MAQQQVGDFYCGFRSWKDFGKKGEHDQNTLYACIKLSKNKKYSRKFIILTDAIDEYKRLSDMINSTYNYDEDTDNYKMIATEENLKLNSEIEKLKLEKEKIDKDYIDLKQLYQERFFGRDIPEKGSTALQNSESYTDSIDKLFETIDF